MIEVLPLAKLRPSKDNLRSDVGNVDELAASIKSLGILEPLVVTPDGSGTYQVVIGHRRLAAAKKAGLPDVPAIVRELEEKDRIELMVVENLQREDLTPLEEARAYSRLADLGYSQREMSERVGASQSKISKRLALVELPPKAVSALDSGRITVDEAMQLAKLKDHPKRLEKALTGVGNIEWAVRSELENIKLEAKLEASRKEFAEKKIPEIPWEKAQRSSALLKDQPWYWSREVDVTPARHRKLDCHAFTVSPRGVLVEICTKPANHSKKEQSRGQKAAETRAKAQAKMERQAAALRMQAIRGVVKKPPARDELLRSISQALVAAAGSSTAKVACQILEIEPTKNRYGSPDYRAGLIKFWEKSKSAADIHRAALAVALAAGEESFRWEADVQPGSISRMFSLLEQNGYRPTPQEKKRAKSSARR